MELSSALPGAQRCARNSLGKFVNSETSLRRTPLFASHQRLGGKLIEFGGWEMPVQYTSISDEHLAVRNAAGLFDISHMGEVLVTGHASADFLNCTLTNDVRKLTPGMGQYTLMCNERGGVVDDLYIYRIGEEEFLLVVNASRILADFGWLQRAAANSARPSVKLEDISERIGAISVQGPHVVRFIDQCFTGPSIAGIPVRRASELKKNQIARMPCGTGEAWVGRTGYTGEDGFEILTSAHAIEAMWDRVVEAGLPHGLKPAGLGARDTLRTEVCYPLYGHELGEDTTPIEAGLGFFVALDKGEFTGREVLASQKAKGVARKLIAFKMVERAAPPRPGYPVWSVEPEMAPIGQVVSGTQSPSLNIGVGMAYVPPAFAKPETTIKVEARGKKAGGMVVAKPIYRRKP